MKKAFLFPALLLCIACSQVNKPLTDADKEKVIGEAKVMVDSIFKLCEKPDPEGLVALYMDSPDFVSLVNKQLLDYKQTCEGARNYLNSMTSQKCTLKNQKYVVLDPTTVYYSADSKWECVTKNDSTIIMDPVGFQLVLKKADNKWKVLSWNEQM